MINNLQVQSTKDYSLFKTVGGNRFVNANHVANLTKEIARNNLLYANPIVVNENFEVIDGQHRLEAARNNDLEVYYIVAQGTGLNDVQGLNVVMRRWGGLDYLQSYISQGKENYIKIAEVMQEYGVSVSTAVEILAGPNYGGTKWVSFKKGEFSIPSLEDAIATAEALRRLRPYCGRRVWADLDFLRAVRKVLETVSIDALVEKLEASGKTIEADVDTRSYIRQFEDVINWKSRGDFLRLY